MEQFSQETNGKTGRRPLILHSWSCMHSRHKLSAPACGGTGTVATRLCWHAYQVASQNRMSLADIPEEGSRAAPFPGPSHLTPQLGAGCGVERPKGGTLAEAARAQVAAQGPPFLQLPQHPNLSPSLELVWDKHNREGTQPRAASGQNWRQLHSGLLSSLWPVGPTYFSTHLLWDRAHS